MPVQHLDAPDHRLPVAYLTREDEARSGGMIGVLLGANDTEVHGEHAKRLVERRVSEQGRVQRPPLTRL